MHGLSIQKHDSLEVNFSQGVQNREEPHQLVPYERQCLKFVGRHIYSHRGEDNLMLRVTMVCLSRLMGLTATPRYSAFRRPVTCQGTKRKRYIFYKICHSNCHYCVAVTPSFLRQEGARPGHSTVLCLLRTARFSMKWLICVVQNSE